MVPGRHGQYRSLVTGVDQIEDSSESAADLERVRVLKIFQFQPQARQLTRNEGCTSNMRLDASAGAPELR